ncbi:MAG: hypothetical protein DRP71_13660 [Verrucomicrobia bacterium]|nr:MAG: hypothetical protein DRP71_13660 [Verrucomicrobiota bacterium]
MFDPTESRQLFLTQDWETAWQTVVKPWLSRSDGLYPGYVLVPTRGQARALRLRMALDGVVSVGARFVTPGLVQRLPLAGLRVSAGVPDRAVLEFALTVSVAEAAARVGAGQEEEGLARSLLSRPSGPLDDWGDLLRAGLDEGSFPHPFVRRVFRLLRDWLEVRGFTVPHAGRVRSPDRIEGADGGDRALIYGFGADCWRDWPELEGLIRAMESVTAVIPFPSFSGKPLEEEWVDLFESALGTEALSLPDQGESRWQTLARGWVLGDSSEDSGIDWNEVPILVGRDPAAEVALVFSQIITWLGQPGARIAVIFPAGSPTVADLAGRLQDAGIRFCDEMATTGAPSGEISLLRAFLTYQRGGCRLEEFWALARLLRNGGQFSLTAGQSRDWIERVFDAGQSHRVEDALKTSEATRSSGGRAMAELAQSVGFWPERLSVARAVTMMEACVERWGLEVPERMGSLDRLAAACDHEYPREAVVDLLHRSLPERAPRQGLVRDDFAPVVLTTRKRATAQVWSHVLFTGSNAEAWPNLSEETFWLADTARREINRKSGKPRHLLLVEDSSILERLSCLDICSNAVTAVAFSACLRVNDGTETDWSPHPWLERVLLQKSRALRALNRAGEPEAVGGFSREDWQALARRLGRNRALPPGVLEKWIKTWKRRRDPAAPFDADFYCHDPRGVPQRNWAARLLEAGFQDPVVLWYEGVLRLRRIPESSLERSRRKEMGSLVHRFLAAALRGDAGSGSIHPVSPAKLCRDRLDRLLSDFRPARPDDAYWQSFHLELAALSRSLLERILGLKPGVWLGAEYGLPKDARLPTIHGDLGVSGRFDLLVMDRSEWDGASATINDFKTGSDKPLNAARMGDRGQSLQLGVYLKAAMELGAAGAVVRMIQPEKEKDSSLADDTLEAIQPAFDRLGRQILSGRYGQLTPERNRFQYGFTGPLACVPIPYAVLEQKYGVTFPDQEGGGDGSSG